MCQPLASEHICTQMCVHTHQEPGKRGMPSTWTAETGVSITVPYVCILIKASLGSKQTAIESLSPKVISQHLPECLALSSR